ncbi:hypothetical protein PDIG_78370 [Penicillium digitatum PHI26]|uniref:Uncharacterized protein n=3 Tax=Penicillium digitatum TaxID=36651 RepID=K9FYZ8_PEND2|nr:hypothetical protein PDIP_26790 [Penicillium digitatum Pd1]EKV06276.1 hypothetical protein PDIG_78370 [Penicillium digitatum PHI26]EKV18412.1 hypothetical protein PDIP_26790 [Penicillium digitatum Pd1]
MVYLTHLVPKASAPPKATAKPSPAAKPGQAQKPAHGLKPALSKKETKPQKKAATDRRGNISDEEYPPLPPSRESSRTGVTPEMSDIDINDYDASDVEIPDADPGNEFLSYPRCPSQILRDDPAIELFSNAVESESSSDNHLYFGSARPNAPQPALQPQHQSGPRSQPFAESRKRAHVEDVENSGQEWSPDSTSIVSSPSKRLRTSVASLQTEAQMTTEPNLSFPRRELSPWRGASSTSSNINTDGDLCLQPSDSTINSYREKGAQLVAWLENPNEPHCNIAPATITLQNMLTAPPADRFEVGNSYHKDLGDTLNGGDLESTGLTTEDNRYRYTSLTNIVTNPEILEIHECSRLSNSYAHLIGPGLIVGHSIFRYDNLQWNEIARALYVNDHDISTLRHVLFTCVINEETAPYVRQILYPRFGRSFHAATYEPCLKIERGTPEYEELLGTKLGKATAILLISSLPRGTRRIARAVVWNTYSTLQLRFEIEPIPANPDDEPEIVQS